MEGNPVETDALQRLKQTTPREFEEFVADVWESRGWDAEVKDKGADGGIDVIATREGVVNQKMLIQAKRYTGSNKVTAGNIREYAGVRNREVDADSMAIVTTNEFTRDAEEEAVDMNIKLIDGEDLISILQDNDAMYILDEYAPTLGEETIDPAYEPEQPTETDELGVEVEGEETVELPALLRNDDTRKKVAGGGIVASLILFLNPSGTTFPIEAIGVLVLLASLAVLRYPEETWDFITPTREEYREFGHGGVVALDGGDIQYEPPGDMDSVVFDSDEDSAQRARQRAVVYGALDNYVGGDLTETDAGVLPTQIANEGARIIAAYRFAVHGEEPSKIASEMGMGQQEVIDHLTAVVN